MGKPITSPGFASPARDYVQPGIDMNELLLPSPASTFAYHVACDSMAGAYVPNPCYVWVDRSVDVEDGDLVVAVIGNEHVIRICRFEKDGPNLYAYPKHGTIKPVKVESDATIEVVGAVAFLIYWPREVGL